MTVFTLCRLMALRAMDLARASSDITRRIAGWWIGKRRGWTPDTRHYGAFLGYEIRYAGRTYWWDGERLTPIAEK
jgi:hypothetical protein